MVGVTVGISQYNPIQFRILTNQNRRTADYIVKLPTVHVGGLCGLGLRDGHRDGVRCCLGERDWKYWTGSWSERGQEHQG